MNHVFRKYLQDKPTLSDEEIATVISFGTGRKTAEAQALVKEGSASSNSGVLRYEA